jgi:hypothetical protein
MSPAAQRMIPHPPILSNPLCSPPPITHARKRNRRHAGGSLRKWTPTAAAGSGTSPASPSPKTASRASRRASRTACKRWGLGGRRSLAFSGHARRSGGHASDTVGLRCGIRGFRVGAGRHLGGRFEVFDAVMAGHPAKVCPSPRVGRAQPGPDEPSRGRGAQQCRAAAAAPPPTRHLPTPRTQAHDLFDEVLITPHLDDATKTSHWWVGKGFRVQRSRSGQRLGVGGWGVVAWGRAHGLSLGIDGG